jgi:GNAT superfamily N-acetyltransferase
MSTEAAELDSRLTAFLAADLGSWPPSGGIEVASSPMRSAPGWDGLVRAFAGISSPQGTVVSVPFEVREAARQLATEGEEAFASGIGALLGASGAALRHGIFRSCRRLVDFGEPGQWLTSSDPRLPEWLAVFPGEVLVVFDEDGHYAAGVGLKAHHRLGREIAVGTEARHRGRGLARALVAQASRAIYEDGAVATYLHAPDNAASAAVAEAAGFPDLGWRALGLTRGR